MSALLVGRVLKQSLAENGERLVMIILADAANNDGITWVCQETIGKLTRLSVAGVRNAIRACELRGELETRKAQLGRRRINVYRVSLSGVEEPNYERLPFKLNAEFTTARIERSSEDEETLDDRYFAAATTARIQLKSAAIPISPTRNVTHKEILTGKTGQVANRNGNGEGRKLVALFVDESTSLGAPPPRQLVTILAGNVGQLLREGQKQEHIADGIRLMLKNGYHPKSLPSFVHSAALNSPASRCKFGGTHGLTETQLEACRCATCAARIEYLAAHPEARAKLLPRC